MTFALLDECTVCKNQKNIGHIIEKDSVVMCPMFFIPTRRSKRKVELVQKICSCIRALSIRILHGHAEIGLDENRSFHKKSGTSQRAFSP